MLSECVTALRTYFTLGSTPRTGMMAFHTVLLLLGCFTLRCGAWPIGIPTHHARAVNPYYTTVDGSSIVNVFPAGYSYQTLLNDGSSSYVIYVSGPESQQYLQNFAHASSLPVRGVLNEGPVGAKDIPPSAQAIDPAPGPDSLSEPVTSTAAAPPATEETPSIPPTGEGKPELNSPQLPVALPQQQPLFHFYPFSPFSNFPVISTYIANPFNSLMSFLGVPPVQGTTNQTVLSNIDSETPNNNNDAQASNVNSVTAPLAARLAVVSPVTDVSTEITVTESSTESKVTEAVTPSVPVTTENTSQTSENESREETTIASSPVATEDSLARVVSEPSTSDVTEISTTTVEIPISSVSQTAEPNASTQNTESVESTSTDTLDTQSTTTDEISTQNSL